MRAEAVKVTFRLGAMCGTTANHKKSLTEHNLCSPERAFLPLSGLKQYILLPAMVQKQASCHETRVHWSSGDRQGQALAHIRTPTTAYRAHG